MESCQLRRAIEAICRYGVVDREVLKRIAGLDDSSVQRVLGVLLSSGYVVEVELRAGVCGSCPLSSVCDYPVRGAGAKIYVPSERLRRLCGKSAASVTASSARAGCGC